jgi:Flp pilus assembly protein TadD
MQRLERAEQRYQSGDRFGALALLNSMQVPEDRPLLAARKHHNCGVILMQSGRPDEAAPHLDLALQYDPADAQAAYLLGILAQHRGDRDEATRRADQALAIDPQFEPALHLKASLIRSAARRKP